jgi:protein-S-isoprenylcysteine O-methyltransferase Ste14
MAKVLNLDFIGRCILIICFATLVMLGLENLNFTLKPLVSLAALPVIIFYTTAAALTVVRLPPKHDSLGWVPRATAVIGSFVLGSLPAVPAPIVYTPKFMQVAAIVISVTFSSLAVACLIALGRSYSVDAQARVLRTSGPYRFVRHPLYLCELTAAASIPISNPALIKIGLWVAAVAIHIWRIRNEETVLTIVYPEYREYAKRVPRLLPWTSRRKWYNQ